MKRSTQTKATIRKATRRRDVLLALGAGAGAAAVPRLAIQAADAVHKDDKLKALYQPNSREVQAYYRVNRYPK